MKNMVAICLAVGLGALKAASSDAQIRINDPGRVAERQAEYRANRKIDQAVDKGFDKMEEGIGNLFKKKNKKQNPETSPANSEATKSDRETVVGTSTTGSPSETKAGTVASGKYTLKSYSKFDFIPGDKIVALEDFSQDAVGDFPAKWNTNSSGEVVTIEGKQGKWLMLGPEGVFYPEFGNRLPDNFTLEYDLATTSEFSFYSGAIRAIFAEVGSASREFVNWRWFDGAKKKGIEVGFHPKGPGGRQGVASFVIFGEETGRAVMKNEKSFPAFQVPDHHLVKVSVWRQQGRLRVYVDDYKVWDLPRAFDPATNYNFVAFSNQGYHDEANRYFISNVRLAVGAPDTRNKLIMEGRFSTTGILFDVSSATIKPESFGVLKEIAGVLAEHAAIQVKIIGHTDSDGDEGSNLSLSQKRSAAVKEALAAEFGIDRTRMQTDGKGEGEPSSSNTTADGKANNRRVEFVKF